MDDSKLTPQIEAKLLELEVLSSLIDLLNSFPNITFLGNEILQKAVSTLNGSCGILFATILKSPILDPVSTLLIEPDRIKQEMFTKNHPVFLSCLKNGETTYFNNYSDKKFEKVFPGKKHFIIAPIQSKNDFFGFIVIGDKESRKGIIEFSEFDKSALTAFANQAAVALRSANLYKQIADIKNYNESILSSIPSAVISFDKFGEISGVNLAAIKLFGKSENKMLGMHYQLLFQKDKHILHLIEKTVTTQLPVLEKNSECSTISTDTVVDFSVSPLKNNVDEISGIVVTVQDLSNENRIKNMFKRYVSDNVVDQLLGDHTKLKLGGEKKEITVLFSDLRGFTSMSEKMEPEEVVSTLNDYFSEMIGIIFENGGTLDKIIGDELMAVFGTPISAPDDVVRAVRTATKMRERLKQFNQTRVKKGLGELKMGIGINSGIAISGNIGSPERMDFTVIGDTVNLGSRLCSNAKSDEIIISFPVFEKVKNVFDCEVLGPIQVKGKEKMVPIFGVR